MPLMNWVFVDPIGWDYDVTTPLTRPLGGSQSALCYLAMALARRGHRITLLSGTSKPREVDGIRCWNLHQFPLRLFSEPDTVTIVLNGPAEIAGQLRQDISQDLTLILWTQIAQNQPPVLALCDPACAAAWDRIVCLTDWHKAMFHQRLGVPLDKMDVLRNAIAPAFENMFRDAEELARAKSPGLRLAYTSAPFRGLDVLLSCFPQVRRRHPACRLDVFSSMQTYYTTAQDDFQPLFALCRTTDGIDYHGSLAQPQLAKELRGVSVLAYPNTFAETSCIVVMEALAAGTLVVTSDLAALPETCDGWARLVSQIGPARPRAAFELDFVNALDAALKEIQSDLPSFVAERFRQVEAVSRSYSWDVRAAEWEQAAARWLQKHA